MRILEGIMQGSLEKTVLEQDFPFRLFFNDGNTSTPHHFHEDIEIIYLVEGNLKVVVNKDTYHLISGEILIIGSGEVHCFFKQTEFSKRAVIQFRMSIYDNFLSGTKDNRIIKPMFTRSKLLACGSEVHDLLEKQIVEIIDEYGKAKEGYKLVLKARLYDLAVILLRYMPKEVCSPGDEMGQMERLKKLDMVFAYVERNHQNHIGLDEISKVAGFSKYHFTRFFKENTGMTFLDYLNNFRITKSEWYLMYDTNSIIEVAYKSGFNSVKTFNRVFKNLKGCAPMEYRKTIK